MSVAKVSEITAASPESFGHAIQTGIERASQTIHNIQSAWVNEQRVVVVDGRVNEYRVNMKVTFVLDE